MSASIEGGGLLDWLEFTLFCREGQRPGSLADEVAEQFAGMSKQETRRGWYAEWGLILGDGWIAWDDDHRERGVHVALPSQALGRLRSDWRGLVQACLEWGVKFTRCDIAIDSDSVVVDRVRVVASDRRNVISHFRKAHVTDDLWEEGSTVAFGKRGSDSYVRIYDKRAEQLGKGETVVADVWTRCEVELRRARAHQAVMLLFGGELAAGIIAGTIDFRDGAQDENSTRCERLDWWQEWLDGVAAVRLRVQGVRSDMQRMRAWLQRQVAVTLGVMAAAEGGSVSWVYDLIADGWDRAPKWKRELAGGVA